MSYNLSGCNIKITLKLITPLSFLNMIKILVDELYVDANTLLLAECDPYL